jgi:hypothetical protein
LFNQTTLLSVSEFCYGTGDPKRNEIQSWNQTAAREGGSLTRTSHKEYILPEKVLWLEYKMLLTGSCVEALVPSWWCYFERCWKV